MLNRLLTEKIQDVQTVSAMHGAKYHGQPACHKTSAYSPNIQISSLDEDIEEPILTERTSHQEHADLQQPLQ